MAQTIAMVRGTASVSATPSNVNTLFTNTASGLGTRVICNMLTVWYTGPYTSGTGDTQTGKFNVIHNSSGGSSQIIGRYNTISHGAGGGSHSQQYQEYAFQFNIFPGIHNNPPQQVMYAVSPTYYPSYAPFGLSYTGHAESQAPATVSISSSNSTEPTYGNNSSIIKKYNFMPQNFWMGPSDTLTFRCIRYGYYMSGKSQVYGYQTCNVGYSFTTITES